MIDNQIFSKGTAMLSSYYNRQLAPEVLVIWKEYLDQALSTEQFQQAIKRAILENRFFPTAKELVEIIKGNSEAQALLEWDLCLKAASRAEYGIVQELSPQAKFALRAVGGVSGVGRVEEADLKWTRKEFVGAWVSWKPSISPALPLVVEDRALPQGVVPEIAEQMSLLSQKLSFNGKREEL